MARNFDGSDQWVSFGADASIAQLLPKTISAWVRTTTFAAFPCIAAKDGSSFWQCTILNTGPLRLRHAFSTTAGIWEGATTPLTTTAAAHIVVSYAGTGTTAIPTMYVNGITQTVNVITAPVGVIVDDTTRQLVIGSTFGLLDLDGNISNFCYDTGTWSAEEANRAKWWGRPKGGVKVYFPFFTDKLTNEGTAVADGVLSTIGGTMIISPLIVPVVIPGSAMMGMGIGW